MSWILSIESPLSYLHGGLCYSDLWNQELKKINPAFNFLRKALGSKRKAYFGEKKLETDINIQDGERTGPLAGHLGHSCVLYNGSSCWIMGEYCSKTMSGNVRTAIHLHSHHLHW